MSMSVEKKQSNPIYLTTDAVICEANKQFAGDKDRETIVEKIKTTLLRIGYPKGLEEGRMIDVSLESQEGFNLRPIEPSLYKAERFIEKLPGIAAIFSKQLSF